MIERYTRPVMKNVWTIENRFAAWLKVEIAVCEAWHKLDRIPKKSIDIIRQKAGFNVERILEIEEITRHDVIAFLTSIEEHIGEEARYVHLGCTSSDIVDTANALLLVQAGKIILEDIDKLLLTLKTLAHKWKGCLCMGRTHGIHAEPTSFGIKIAGFYAEFLRHRTRFKAATEDIRVGKLSGAVGTYAFLSPEVEELTMQNLGLKVDMHSTQIIQRDRYAHFFTSLAIMAGGVERLCVELRHLQRTEVSEIEEGFSKGQKGSSAMPHKKNPISAENMTGLARLIRTNALASLENQALWHERDISHSSVERVIMPDCTILADYILSRLTTLLDNLVVKPEQMRSNMEKSFGLFFSQRILTVLIDCGLARQKAYELVQKCAMQSWDNQKSFPDIVRQCAEITSLLNKSTLDEVFSTDYYLQYEDVIFARVFSEDEAINAR